MIEKRERRRLFHAHESRSHPAIAQSRRRYFRRALIFLPDANFRREKQLLAQASLFKPRHDKYGIPRPRKHESKQALADPPANPGEVIKRSPRSKEQSVVFRLQLRHHLLSVQEPLVILVSRDGMNPRTEWLEIRKGLRERPGAALSHGLGQRRHRQSGGSCGALQKLAPRRLVNPVRTLFVHGSKEI